MALGEEEEKRVRKLVDQLNSLRKKLEKDPITVDFKILNEEGVKQLNDELEKAQLAAEGLEDGFIGISQSLANVVGEIGKSNTALNKGKSAFKGIKSIAEKFRDDQLEISRLSEKEIVSLQQKLQTQQQNLKEVKAELELKQKSNQKLSDSEEALLAEMSEESTIISDLNGKIKERLKDERRINNTMGLTGKLLGGMEKSLTKLGFDSSIFSEATERGREAAEKGAGAFKVMAIQLFEIGKGIGRALVDPLSLSVIAATSLFALISSLKKLVFEFSQESVDLGRNFGTAGDQAQRVTAELRTMAATSDFLKGELIEGFTELNQSAGTFGKISKENLEFYVGLTKNAGYSKDLGEDLYKLAVLQGKEAKELGNTEFKRIKSLAKLENSAINQKEVFEEIGKMSAATQLSILGQGKALGDAAFQAKKLGMDMQILNGIADSLLDFESSIAAEMEAELLTGRALNLERARAAALSNDMATLGKELEKQNITAVTFSKQNRIQQEATAKALGLNRDALAESLLKQEAIRRGIVQEGEVSLDQQLKQLSLQERYNRFITNLKEIFVNQLQPVIKDITSFLSDEENYKGFVEGVKSIASGFGEFLISLKEGPGLLKRIETAAISIAIALTAAALASSIATGGISTLLGLGAFAAAGLGTYAVMGGFDSSSPSSGNLGGGITTSSNAMAREDNAMVEAIKENTRVNKEVLAETKKSRYTKISVNGEELANVNSTAGTHSTQ